MEHPDEGEIRAFMDGEAGEAGPALEAHITGCPRCSAIVQEQEGALAAISTALSAADVSPPLERVSRRIRSAGKEKRTLGLVRWSLPKAASIAVLLTAGAAAALPGSPIREWFRGGPRVSSQPGQEAATVSEPASEVRPSALAPGTPGMVGASLPVKEGRMTIRIEEVTEGSEITVQLVAGDQVGVFSGEGTRFRTGTHLVEARGAPGDLRVELPQGSGEWEMVVEGRIYLRQVGGELEILGPVQSRTPSEIRFEPWRSPEEQNVPGGEA